jgi:hypothetical protein
MNEFYKENIKNYKMYYKEKDITNVPIENDAVEFAANFVINNKDKLDNIFKFRKEYRVVRYGYGSFETVNKNRWFMIKHIINSIVENIQSVTVQRQSNDTPSSKRNIQIMNSRSAKENNSADGKKKYENGKVSNANDKPFIPEK